MSILIKGMEMPICHFKTSESYNVNGFWMVYPDGKSKLHIIVGSDNLVCEAIPVPEHGDLIDRDALRDNNCDAFEISGADGTILAMDVSIIDAAPTIISADPAEEGE